MVLDVTRCLWRDCLIWPRCSEADPQLWCSLAPLCDTVCTLHRSSQSWWSLSVLLTTTRSNTILIKLGVRLSVRAFMCPHPISTLLFLLYKKFSNLKVLYLLCQKFLKGETWSYLGLKARITRTEKLVTSIFKFPDDKSLSTEVCLRQYFMHRAKMGSARKISFIIHVNF